jgi:hypothetical protein
LGVTRFQHVLVRCNKSLDILKITVTWISGRMPLPKTEARMEMERNALKVFSDLDELNE